LNSSALAFTGRDFMVAYEEEIANAPDRHELALRIAHLPIDGPLRVQRGATVERGVVAYDDERSDAPALTTGSIVFRCGLHVCARGLAASGAPVGANVVIGDTTRLHRPGAAGGLAAWIDEDAQVQVAPLPPLRGKPRSPTLVSIGNGGQTRPLLALGGDRQLVAWIDSIQGPRFAVLDLDGKVVQRAEMLSIKPYRDFLAVAGNDHGFFFAWRERDEAGRFEAGRFMVAHVDRNDRRSPPAEVFRLGDPEGEGSSRSEHLPALAAGARGALAVWMDGELWGRRLLAARIDDAGKLVDHTPITICEPCQAEHYTVAAGADGWLVAWTAMTHHGHQDPPRALFAARVDATGRVLDARPIKVAQPATAASLAWHAGSWLLAWTPSVYMAGATDSVDILELATMDSAGTVGSRHSIPVPEGVWEPPSLAPHAGGLVLAGRLSARFPGRIATLRLDERRQPIDAAPRVLVDDPTAGWSSVTVTDRKLTIAYDRFDDAVSARRIRLVGIEP
jgi:hypothetical protein